MSDETKLKKPSKDEAKLLAAYPPGVAAALAAAAGVTYDPSESENGND